jgi:hypothetical protein
MSLSSLASKITYTITLDEDPRAGDKLIDEIYR